ADPAARITSCEEPSTTVLLQNVARVPGAIGYAEASDVGAYGSSSIQPVEIDGLSADVGAIGTGPGTYRFWTVEYLYSYGAPPDGSLGDAFLGYLHSYAAKDVLRSRGYVPCTDRGLSHVGIFCHP